MTQLYLTDIFAKNWPDQDAFDTAMALQGELFRDMPSRRTLKFFCDERPYFAKIHTGVGWREIFKNLLQWQQPILDASPEWLAIRRVTELGIDTMNIAGYGVRGVNPASRESFLITESLENTESLEDYCRDWRKSPPDFRLKLALLKKVAEISRNLHSNGINHRDFYICHFLLDLQAHRKAMDADHIRLFLIDLHRAQIRNKVPERWLVKDIGSLYFSAMDIGLTRRDLLRFMKIYSGHPLRKILIEEKPFWEKVTTRAIHLYKKMHGAAPNIEG